MEFFNSGLCKTVIVFCFFVCANSQSCQTPTRESGSCIPIKSCKFLSDRFENVPKPLNPEQIAALQSYHCGFDGATPKVCCPPDSTANRFSVTNHRNLRLINQHNCGGKVASLSQYPWMALIAHDSRPGVSFRCGGTLINENYILTAAQCITNLKSHTLAGVRLGEYDIRTEIDCYNPRGCAPPVQDFTIVEVIPHPLYNPNTMENDIGLLRLNRPADMTSESVKPVCLPTGLNDLDSLVGKEATLTGWGVTETGFASSKLLKITLPILGRDDCQSRYNQKNTRVTIGVRQMCAGGVRGKDSCSGDGGGPLGLANAEGLFVQYGIVSFGSRYCGIEQQNLPGVHTNVAKYIDWILDNIRA